MHPPILHFIIHATPHFALYVLRIARGIFAFEFLSYFSKNTHIRILLCSCINLYFFDFLEVYAHSPVDYLEEYLHSPLMQLIRDYHNKFSNRVVFVGPWWFGRAWYFVLVEHEIPFWLNTSFRKMVLRYATILRFAPHFNCERKINFHGFIFAPPAGFCNMFDILKELQGGGLWLCIGLWLCVLRWSRRWIAGVTQ